MGYKEINLSSEAYTLQIAWMIQLYKEAQDGDFNRRHRTTEEEASLRQF